MNKLDPAEEHLKLALTINTLNKYGVETVHPLDKAIAHLALAQIAFQDNRGVSALNSYMHSFAKFRKHWSDMIASYADYDEETEIRIQRAVELLKYDENEKPIRMHEFSESTMSIDGNQTESSEPSIMKGGLNIVESSSSSEDSVDNEWLQVIHDENNINFFSKSVDEDLDDSRQTKETEEDDNSLLEEAKQHISRENAQTIRRVLSNVFKGSPYDEKRTSERILQMMSASALSSPGESDQEDENDVFDSSHIVIKDELVRSSGVLPSFHITEDADGPDIVAKSVDAAPATDERVKSTTLRAGGDLSKELSRSHSSNSNVWRPSLRLHGVSPADFFKKKSSTVTDRAAEELVSSAGDEKSSLDYFDARSEVTASEERFNFETFEYYDDFQGENVVLRHSTML